MCSCRGIYIVGNLKFLLECCLYVSFSFFLSEWFVCVSLICTLLTYTCILSSLSTQSLLFTHSHTVALTQRRRGREISPFSFFTRILIMDSVDFILTLLNRLTKANEYFKPSVTVFFSFFYFSFLFFFVYTFLGRGELVGFSYNVWTHVQTLLNNIFSRQFLVLHPILKWVVLM